MPMLRLTDGDLHYQLDGPATAPVLILSNSLGTDLQMWDAQVPAFAEHLRVLRYESLKRTGGTFVFARFKLV